MPKRKSVCQEKCFLRNIKKRFSVVKKSTLREYSLVGPEKVLCSSDLVAMAERLRYSGKKMADIFGLTSQGKYKEIVIERPAKEGKRDLPLDKGLSLLLRFYLAYPTMVPR